MGDSTFLTAVGAEVYEGFGRIEDMGPSQTTVLLQKKREMQTLQRQLIVKQDECERRLAACTDRESLLEDKQLKIQDAIRRFDKFIQENDVKRSRAARKEREERQERLQREKEASALATKLDELKSTRLKQKHQLQAGKVYERYLENVVEASRGDFEEINDALMRFATLKGTMEDLEESGETLNRQLEETKARSMQEQKEKGDALLMATSSIAKKQKDLENLRNTRMLLEQRLAAQKDSDNQHVSTTGEARRAIANIYLRCRKANHPLLDPEAEVLKALDYIKFRCGDLGKVTALKSQAPEKKPPPTPQPPPKPAKRSPGRAEGSLKHSQTQHSNGSSVAKSATAESQDLRASMIAPAGRMDSVSTAGTMVSHDRS